MLIDSHFHLANETLRISQKDAGERSSTGYSTTPNVDDGKTLDEVLAEARKNSVDKFILVGTNLKDNERILAACKKHDDLYAVIGSYPHEDLDKSLSEIYEGIHTQYLANRSKIVAIGECGIDITDREDGRNIEDQIELFKMQIGFATNYGLPIVVHNRNGDDQVLHTIQTYNKDGVQIKGVLHCFASNWEFAKQMLDLGFYISFSGLITYPSKKIF